MQRFYQQISHWLFSSTPVLRARSSMAWLAVLLMAGASGVMLWLGHSGYGWLQPIRWWCIVAMSGQLCMALLVRSGITARWRDPSVTFLQIMWAVTCGAVAYAILGAAKGMVPGLLAVSLFFAALSLRAKQIVAVTLYATCSFALAMFFAIHIGKSDHANLEVGYAAVLAIMLIGCMLLSLRLHQLRARLRRQRQELAVALEEKRELASRDPLTGLLNRRYMLELLQLEQSRCERNGRPMLLAQLDIDHFKAINDTYGHSVGDQALKTFAVLVRNCIRSSDALARWGGEEFVLLLSDTTPDGALLTLQRIRMAVQNAEVRLGQVTLRMTVSIGLAEHRCGDSLEDTLDRADRALYRAKHEGRNRVLVAPLLPSAEARPDFLGAL